MVDKNTMQKLAELTQKLDAESDSHNKLIADFEKRLQDMRVAVTVWQDMDTTEAERWTKEEDDRGNPIEPAEEWQRDYQLGYTGQRLCVRQATYKNELDYNGNEHWVLKDTGALMPLLSVSRALRVEAARYFNALTKKLVEKTEAYLKDIEAAKKLV